MLTKGQAGAYQKQQSCYACVMLHLGCRVDCYQHQLNATHFLTAESQSAYTASTQASTSPGLQIHRYVPSHQHS